MKDRDVILKPIGVVVRGRLVCVFSINLKSSRVMELESRVVVLSCLEIYE